MKLELRFFASLREAVGTSQETIEVPEEVKTVSQLRAHLIARGGVWAEALAGIVSKGCPLHVCTLYTGYRWLLRLGSI